MEIKTVTWGDAVQVWWSLAWRSVVFILPASFIVGAILGLVMSVANIPIEPYRVPMQLLGAAIAICISIWIIKGLLNKSYRGFRLVVVREASASDQDQKLPA